MNAAAPMPPHGGVCLAMRGLFVAKIFVGLLTIGLLGFLTDQIFKWLHRKLLPWSPRIG